MDKRRRIVGVLISDAHHKFFRQCLYSVQKELLANNMDVVTFTTLCKPGMNKDYSDAVLRLRSHEPPGAGRFDRVPDNLLHGRPERGLEPDSERI